MNTSKHLIMTIEFDDKELSILATARELLCEVSAKIPDDYLENAESWDDNISAGEVEIALRVLRILHNGGVSTNWEIEE